jgi:hypothetical protein
MCLLKGSATFAVIAGWAGCNQVAPIMFSTLAARDYVIDCKPGSVLTAVLAGEIIPPHYLSFIELDSNARPFNHPFEPDD